MKRRTLLATALSASLAPGFARRARGRSVADTGLQLYGLQLYTVRDLLRQDFEGTLARIAALGYRTVEFGGIEGPSPRRTLAILKRHGLAAPSGHAPYDQLDRHLDQVLQEANEREQTYVVCPFLDQGLRRTLDDWKRLSARFNAIGERARTAGLSFAYHNHDFEFAPIAGQVPYDLLLAATDPALVGMEVDLYWMTRAGRDPVATFQSHPGRFPLLHLKDRTSDGAIAALGRGVIDFRRILGHAAAAGVTHGFVEHDDPADPMQSIETSLRYLQQLDV